MDADISIKTSPSDPDKYQPGEIYSIKIGNHLIEARCIATDGEGLFHFTELRELQEPIHCPAFQSKSTEGAGEACLTRAGRPNLRSQPTAY